jgi:hypothetical protein
MGNEQIGTGVVGKLDGRPQRGARARRPVVRHQDVLQVPGGRAAVGRDQH